MSSFARGSDDDVNKSQEKSNDESPENKNIENKIDAGTKESRDASDQIQHDERADEIGEEMQLDHLKDTDEETGSQSDTVKYSDDTVIVRKINTGRWSTKEHDLFLEGLQKYGKEWKRVAGNVGTRSVMQTRTHAQKHFDRLKPGGGKGGIWGTTKPSGSSMNSITSSNAGIKRSASDSNERGTRSAKNIRNEAEEAYSVPPKMQSELSTSKGGNTLTTRQSEEAAQDRFEPGPGESLPFSKRVYPFSQAASTGTGNICDSSSTIRAGGLVGGYGIGYSLPPPVFSHVRPGMSTPTPSGIRSPHHFGDGRSAVDSVGRPTSPQSDIYNMPYASSEYFNPHGTGGSIARGARGGTPFSDRDILLPMTNHTIKSVANREYIDVLRANSCIFHALPGPDQLLFVQNICNFLQVVRGRRWFFTHHQWGTPIPLVDPTTAVAAELRQDSLKYAALQFHPYWLLGEFDVSNPRRSDPFAYRRSDGSWIPIDRDEARDVLRNEGPKTLLVLPPSIEISERFPA